MLKSQCRFPTQRSRSISTWLPRCRYLSLFLATVIFLLGGCAVMAQSRDNITGIIDPLATIWMLVASALVFLMNAGFALLEAGFCRQKNLINVLGKNLIVFCVSMIAFWSIGFGLMFGDGNPLFGESGFFFEPDKILNVYPPAFQDLSQDFPTQAFAAVFFFQLVFSGTAATIVSGAVDERVKFWAFFWFSFFLVAISYPITGHWVWGSNGWLKVERNFLDFAGSTVVHSVGGMAGLVGACLLGPRLGRFLDKPLIPAQPEEMANQQEHEKYKKLLKKYKKRQGEITPAKLQAGFATLGCLILWLGWIGFNGGSVGDRLEDIPHVIATTMISGCSGGIAVLIFSELFSKPGLNSIINGILGALVGITASSAFVEIIPAIIIGTSSGFVVLLFESILERLKIDDPVGAVPVHLGCGVWGTFLAGLFANKYSSYVTDNPDNFDRGEQIFNQVIGILAVNAFALVFSLLAWLLIGVLLHWLSRPKTRTVRESGYQDSPNLGEQLIQLINDAKKAIRVSRKDEIKGNDGYFRSP